jgi:hypothetical protein
MHGGIERISGGSCIALLLGAGEELSERIACSGLPRGISTVELEIDATGDTNGSNDTGKERLSSSPGLIVINEIMYRPGLGGEWIELRSRSSESLDLSGWKIRDRTGSCGTIAAGALAPAQSFIIIAQQPGSLLSLFPGIECPVLPLEEGWPRLNDCGGSEPDEEIFVLSAGGTVVESVSYGGICGEERGRSIERVSPDICSAQPAGIWLRCGAEAGATPGRENYCRIGKIPPTWLEAVPDPFSVERDRSVRFAAASLPGEGFFRAAVYDIEGREIRKLPSGPVAAPAVSFLWDGRDGDGRPVRTGIYICIVEFLSGGGGVCRREKLALAVRSCR